MNPTFFFNSGFLFYAINPYYIFFNNLLRVQSNTKSFLMYLCPLNPNREDGLAIAVATTGVAQYSQKQNAIYEQDSVGTFRGYVGFRLWLPDSLVVATGDSPVGGTLCYQQSTLVIQIQGTKIRNKSLGVRLDLKFATGSIEGPRTIASACHYRYRGYWLEKSSETRYRLVSPRSLSSLGATCVPEGNPRGACVYQGSCGHLAIAIF
ncbi:hypothetical protein TSAR_008196 [Trichomalopsis sarcophagae]|uniref:Uncharacterized protein n=1 Tax=Trichomalopsis sarcophagae TaxID=543379 RepID=A0A232EHE0_9HYME|nr:hypothetical protein TSAR_008196 [Trichomalopsis sarcophagae]